MRIFFITIVLILLGFSLFGQKFSVNNIEVININNAFYPQFSKDGNSLFYTSSNYSGLWEYNLSNSQSNKINDYLGAGMSPVLTVDGSSIIFRKDEYKNRRKFSSIVAYNLKTKSEKVLEEDNRYLTRPIMSTKGDIVYKIKNNFQIYRNDLKSKINVFSGKLIDANNDNLIVYEDSNPVTLYFSEESLYLWASLSPDQAKMLFTKAGEGTFISDLTGKILVELGYANAPVWSPDSKWIAYMVDKDDGHQITSSDIFVVSVDGSVKYKITHTNNEIEMYPKWSPDGSKITFNTLDGILKIAYLDLE